jgi:hypothetical protein
MRVERQSPHPAIESDDLNGKLFDRNLAEHMRRQDQRRKTNNDGWLR